MDAQERKEKKEQIVELLKKESNLSTLCQALDLGPYEVIGLVKEIKDEGVNIVEQRKADGIYMFNKGDMDFTEEHKYRFHTDEAHEFKFLAIADTRLGSKYQQLSILNDVYEKAYNMGYRNVILCGNISSGLYSISDIYAETNFLADTQTQIDYIVEYFPRIEGMKTYFITGKRDDIHLMKKKISIGKRIADQRDDMIFLGDDSCDVKIDNVRMHIMSRKLGKTYTASYRAQQQIDSYRSEDKPDCLLYGGLLQMEKFTYRGVSCISIPSLVATTKEMEDKRYANTIGAWFVTVKTDEKGNLLTVEAINSPYYKTNKEDYKKAKVLRIGGLKGGK